jgi:hypothetical protein
MAAALPLQGRAADRREARLRPEHWHLYPGLVAGEWESAAITADRVLAGRLLRGDDLRPAGRMLVDAHFEFRGGAASTSTLAARPRREDR